MLGVSFDGPANVLVDNDSTVKNSTISHSTLQRKHNLVLRIHLGTAFFVHPSSSFVFLQRDNVISWNYVFVAYWSG